MSARFASSNVRSGVMAIPVPFRMIARLSATILGCMRPGPIGQPVRYPQPGPTNDRTS
jgi:hypothetical protein